MTKSDTSGRIIQVLSLLEQGSSMERRLGFEKMEDLGFKLELVGLVEEAMTMS